MQNIIIGYGKYVLFLNIFVLIKKVIFIES